MSAEQTVTLSDLDLRLYGMLTDVWDHALADPIITSLDDYDPHESGIPLLIEQMAEHLTASEIDVMRSLKRLCTSGVDVPRPEIGPDAVSVFPLVTIKRTVRIDDTAKLLFIYPLVHARYKDSAA